MQNSLKALAIVGLVDAISFMVVSPSIVFYVTQNGGTLDQYGLILSSFSFASFCFKPILGWWTDVHGFIVPYIASLSIASFGGILYFMASLWEQQDERHDAIWTILLSRLLGGAGAASSAIGFAYVARVVKVEEQTSVNSVLSMVRILGMVVGPGLNVFLHGVDLYVGGVHVDSLNSVGLVIFVCNVMAILSVLVFLEEPTLEDDDDEEAERAKCDLMDKDLGDVDEEKRKEMCQAHIEQVHNVSTMKIIMNVLSPHILVPVLSIFTLNANFQMIETGLAPSAHDALGWGPVRTSFVMGSTSIIIALNMMIVFKLSSTYHVSDSILLLFGQSISILGFYLIYDLWKRDSPNWHFYVPVFISCCAFPYTAAPTRSIYTKAVAGNKVFRKHRGMMQALLSMVASVAGFVTPHLVAKYCLRTPEEVDASKDKKELTVWSLFAPIFSFVTLVGVLFVEFILGGSHTKKDEEGEENGVGSLTTEATSLLRSGSAIKNDEVDMKRRSMIMAHHQQSASFLGMPHPENEDESMLT